MPDKQFRQSITVSPHSLTMLNTTNAEFSFIKYDLQIKTINPIEKEDSMNFTLIIGTKL